MFSGWLLPPLELCSHISWVWPATWFPSSRPALFCMARARLKTDDLLSVGSITLLVISTYWPLVRVSPLGTELSPPSARLMLIPMMLVPPTALTLLLSSFRPLTAPVATMPSFAFSEPIQKPKGHGGPFDPSTSTYRLRISTPGAFFTQIIPLVPPPEAVELAPFSATASDATLSMVP